MGAGAGCRTKKDRAGFGEGVLTGERAVCEDQVGLARRDFAQTVAAGIDITG
jgi:hypothetical protein